MNLLTTDLHEGAWLLSQGMELVKLYPMGNPSTSSGHSGKRRVVFEFSGQKGEVLLEQYRKRRAEGDVVRFQQAVDELKDRMFSLLRGTEVNQMRWRWRKGEQDEVYRRGAVRVKS